MTGFTHPVGVRVIEEQSIRVDELGYVFTRTDRHERQRNRSTFLTEGRQWLHLTLALERWVVKKARRIAGETEVGLAYSRPHIEYERRPDLRAWQVAVWLDYGVIPGRQGDTIRFYEGISKEWQPL